MAHRKIHPMGAISWRCDVCGFVTVKLTLPEWKAKQRVHELSLRHKAALKRVG